MQASILIARISEGPVPASEGHALTYAVLLIFSVAIITGVVRWWRA